MNSFDLSNKVVDHLDYQGKLKEILLDGLYNELSQTKDESAIKLVLTKLCDKIDELKEINIKG